MAAKSKVSVSVRPATPRLSGVERRAAEVAMLSTKQAELKREAAERQRARALHANASVGQETPAATRDH
jgi:hypothetical protein